MLGQLVTANRPADGKGGEGDHTPPTEDGGPGTSSLSQKVWLHITNSGVSDSWCQLLDAVHQRRRPHR
jgi:hypothetical protein